jgi:hypothetical protein
MIQKMSLKKRYNSQLHSPTSKKSLTPVAASNVVPPNKTVIGGYNFTAIAMMSPAGRGESAGLGKQGDSAGLGPIATMGSKQQVQTSVQPINDDLNIVSFQ